MADLRVKGEYVGPGEQRTAEFLAANLPDDWVIFAGRKLPGPNRDDADLVVVGASLVFVIEEKAWGPTVVVDDNHWYVRGNARPNPLNRVGQVARIVAGILRDRARGYANLGHQHRVVPSVVLSHPNLQILLGRNHDGRERIWALADAPEALVSLDDGFRGASLGGARRAVITYLDDLPKPDGRPSLGGYTLETRLASAGQEQAWLAIDSTGEQVVLKCYPAALLGAHGNPEEFLRREYVAVNRAADLGRTWRAFPPFADDTGDLYVVPVVPPRGGTTLDASVQTGMPERRHGKVEDDLARAVAIDAFRALQDIHDAGLVHRALHPKRVWLHQKRRVMFSDLNLARIEGDTSIALWARDGDMSEDYRAPECAPSLALATTKSDVYSLALCVCYWLLGEDVSEMSLQTVESDLVTAYPWAEPIKHALSGTEGGRPDAGALADSLMRPAPQPEPSPPSTPVGVFEDGGLIADRYEIVRKLGRGGFATSWRVYDRQRELPMVLKQFHQDLPENVRAEFQAAYRLHHDNCASVYDIHVSQAPHYLVSEYVEGESLAEEGRAFAVDELRDIAMCVLTALDYIHGHDLVHGDVTPSNVIAAPDGRSGKLIDFGLMVRDGYRPAGVTPRFAAPEVREGKAVTAASDLFGFASTMAYAMLGRLITSDASGALELIAPTRAEEDAWGPGGTQLLRSFMTAAALSPADRPPSAAALLEIVRSTSIAEPKPAPDGHLELRINPNVASIRRLYRASAAGNAGNRGLDDDFAVATYVPTRLDKNLLPKVLSGDLDLVLLSGNPGDGKTSLLVQLGQILRDKGAEVLHADEAGWKLELGDRTFYAVFDASEAHGTLSSDDLVKQALDPAVSQKDGPATALIAVNDGRLHQFFEDHSDVYEDWWFQIQDQIKGQAPGESRVALVDLKRRSLASTDGSGLASEALASLTTDALWEACTSCSAKTGCPILANRASLRGAGAEAFGELMLISHLRRRRRATFRDVRSAAAWLLTGDRDCTDVHKLVHERRNASLMSDALVYDLAFAADSNDYLVDEWSDLDPGLVPNPTVDRARRESASANGTSYLRTVDSVARAIYFGERLGADIDRGNVRAYRYLIEFLEMLAGTDPIRTRDRLLLGISRLRGAHGYQSAGLAFGVGAGDSAWAILHTIDADSFSVHVADPRDEYLEVIPDLLELAHHSRARLTLTLDTAEMILRAADGEIVNDRASDAIRQEIDAFVGQLSRHASKSAHIVDSSGSVTTATIDGTSIRFDLDGQGLS